MINLERIEKAYLRFQNMAVSLQFRTVKKEIGWEVVQHGTRLLLTSTEEECNKLVEELDISVQEIIREEYDRMMNELKEADTS